MQEPAIQNIIEGTWEEVSSHVAEFNGHRLRVIILPDDMPSLSSQMITRGMFPQLADISEDAFKIADFHGDLDDGFELSKGHENG